VVRKHVRKKSRPMVSIWEHGRQTRKADLHSHAREIDESVRIRQLSDLGDHSSPVSMQQEKIITYPFSVNGKARPYS